MSQMSKLIAVFTVIFLAAGAFAVLSSDDSDATAIGSVTASDFKENSSGTLSVKVVNSEGADIDITLAVYDGDEELKTVTETVSNGTDTVDISLRLDAGSYDLTVKATAVLTGTTESVEFVNSTSTVTVDVDESIWSGWVPYVVLVILAIIILIVVYLWYRGRPKQKATVTFADLEEGKPLPQEAQASETGRKKYEADKAKKEDSQPSTGRIKYKSDRRK